MEYFLILLVVAASSILTIFHKRNAIFLLPVIVLLVIFSGTRYQSGNDWRGYQEVFESAVSESSGLLDFSGRMEPGYMLMNNAVATLGGDLWWIFMLFSVLNLYFFCKGFMKYTPFVSVALLLYMRFSYLQLDFMFLRQGLAIAMFFYAIKYIKIENPYKYFFLISISCLFHISSIILFPVYFLVSRSYRTNALWGLALLAFVLGMLPWVEILFSVIERPLELVGLASPIKSYLYGENWVDQGKGFSFSMLEKLIVLLFFSYYYNYFYRRIEYFSIFYNLAFIAFLVGLLFMNYYVFSERIVIIFNVSYIVLISYSLLIMSSYTRILFLVLLVLYVAFWWVRYILASDVYIPYYSVFYSGFL